MVLQTHYRTLAFGQHVGLLKRSLDLLHVHHVIGHQRPHVVKLYVYAVPT